MGKMNLLVHIVLFTFSFTCDCTNTGFEGQLCEVSIDECVTEAVSCYHGVKCRDEVNGLAVSCMEGFTGIYCQVQKVFVVKTGHFCYELDVLMFFQDDFPDCLSQPCKNGGTCLEISKTENYPRIKPLINDRDFSYDDAAGYACECAEGFEG